MNLNPEQQAQFDAIKTKYNYTPTQQTATPASDWFTTTAPKPVPDNSYGGFGKVAKDIGADWNKRADNVGQIENSDQNYFSKKLQGLGQGAGAIQDTIGDVIKSAVKPEVLQKAGNAIHPLIEAAQSNPAGHAVLNWWADLEHSQPELAKNLEATGNITMLLSNALGVGAGAKGFELGTEAATKAVAPLAEKATGAVQGAKDAVKNATPSFGGKSFNEVYTSHAQSTKALGNAVKAGTITKDGKTISPIDTMEAYQATPKVIGKTSGGHGLDMTDVRAEAETNSKAANKAVDSQIADMMKLKPFAYSRKEVMGEALDAAAKDKEIVRTASLPGVQTNIKQIFQDYALKGDTITPEQLNEFRKGANQASQAYYNAQRVAATAGAIPKDVADRAQAFAVLGDVFREQLVKFDPSLDTLLTTQRLHNAVQQYAARAHLSSVGVSGGTRAGIDAAGAGVGAVLGSTVGGPVGAGVGAAAGAGLTEKAQAMLLRRTYEGAQKMSQSTPSVLPESAISGGAEGLTVGKSEFTPISRGMSQSKPNQSPMNPNAASKNTIDTKSSTPKESSQAPKTVDDLNIGLRMKDVTNAEYKHTITRNVSRELQKWNPPGDLQEALGNENYFRLEQLQAKDAAGQPLSDADLREAVGLLRKEGIETAPNVQTYLKNKTTAKLEGSSTGAPIPKKK